ncbi:MAG: hydroxymethylbilane synthase [Parvularculaceae bacterium]
MGTRSSAMALAQTDEAVRRLRDGGAATDAETVRFKPLGDVDQISKLDRHGGKGGAFVGEIRAAMVAGELDAAMHSLKDMPGDEEAPGLVIAAMMTREPAEDVLAFRPGVDVARALADGLAGLKLGTNSVRRGAYLNRLFPEATVIHYRGAADTRLKKLDEGAMQKLPDGGEVGPADAIVVARAGLVRIGRPERVDHVFPIDDMLPAVGQGIVALECPTTHWKSRAALAAVDDQETRACGEAEREMLWILNGHCNAPIAGHARLRSSVIEMRGAVISLDGATIVEAAGEGPIDRPRELGRRLGLELLSGGADKLIAAARP